jgi:chorismate mutase
VEGIRRRRKNETAEIQKRFAIKMNIEPIQNWLPGTVRPIIISGPCGAETEEQMLSTAAGLAKLNAITVFRSGIWKPRTRPNSFEGVGLIGLKWLQEVKSRFGFLTAVEVANAWHVEEALKNKVDILWIGARTTVNPFSVQEIADALKGISIPVMVKNPIHADIQLWIGALERINQAGITKLAAIHRGFFSGSPTHHADQFPHDHSIQNLKFKIQHNVYRNPPQWEIPIELKTQFPLLPIFCDPSHICGSIGPLQGIAQKALDLNFDGLMLESHSNPAKALSDKDQQLTPGALGELLNTLVVRTTGSNSAEFINKLELLRKTVDEIDLELIDWLSKRMELIEQIGIYKQENNITVLQLDRWLEILHTRSAWAEEKGLDKEFIQKIYKLLHKESIRIQTGVMNERLENS